jgi:hypothetical protein
VETVAGQVLSTKQELWHLDGEKTIAKKVHVSVKSITEGERF